MLLIPVSWYHFFKCECVCISYLWVPYVPSCFCVGVGVGVGVRVAAAALVCVVSFDVVDWVAVNRLGDPSWWWVLGIQVKGELVRTPVRRSRRLSSGTPLGMGRN